jgi:transcriptional regulator with XRE-family HTH domain
MIFCMPIFAADPAWRLFNMEKNDKKAMSDEIATRIATLAEKANVSIRRALQESGVQSNFYHNISARGSVPAADSLLKVADYFGVSVDYLLGRMEADQGLPDAFRRICARNGISDSMGQDEKQAFLDYIEMQVIAYKSLKGQRA